MRVMGAPRKYSVELQQRAVFFAVADLLNLEVDLLLFDTTSTYFERDTDEGDGGFRRYGHSKDHRSICRRSSSGSPSPRKASRCAAGAGRATPTTRPCCPRCAMGCGTGASGGWSRSSTGASPRKRTWTT
jgi:hypothetical protein